MFGWLSGGKMELKIDKYNFSPGETISGQAVLTVKKTVHARAVKIKLFCEERIVQGFGANRNYRTVILFDFDQPLDGEKDYGPAQGPLTYNFNIKIPSDVVGKMPEGAIGTIANVATALSGTRSNKKWYLKAYLDIPLKIDISKQVQINVA